MIYGTYLLILLAGGSFILWPEESMNVLLVSSYKIQVYWINWRMKSKARQLHRQLTRMCEQNGFPPPGPFRFTNIWDRDR